jgi:hypothetical protein
VGLDIKVVSFGFGSLALALGFVLLALSFNYTKDPTLILKEQSAGWILIGIGVFAWAVGVVNSTVRIAARKHGFHR